MKARHAVAVAVGVIIGFILTLGFGLALGFALVAYQAAGDILLKEISRNMSEPHLAQSLPLLLGSLGVGGFALLTAGFLTGWIARSHQVLTGTIMGVVSTVPSAPFAFLWPYPAWYNVAAILFTIGPAAMGGYLAQVMLGVGRTSPPAKP